MNTEIEAVCRILAERQYPVVIELGAHHGCDTSVMYDACKPHPGLFLAVEADPRNIPNITEHMKDRPFVKIIHAAIAAHDGEVDLWLSDAENYPAEGTGSSSIRKPTKHQQTWPHITFDRRVKVPGYSLDSLYGLMLFKQAGEACRVHWDSAVDLIWCDIQGSENSMLAGGRNTLRRTRWLLLEADREAYYDGAATRDEMPSLLPDFELVQEWPEHANMLFKHR